MLSQSHIEVVSALIVVGGTLLATILRCGLADTRKALRVLARLPRRRFDAEGTRAELAAQIREIRQDGLIRAEAHQFDDLEFDEATRALIGTRSVAALHAAHQRHRAHRIEVSEQAAQVLAQAAEMAPVFGLAGTLISLSQLRVDGASTDLTGAIGMAVLTTLYGLLLGNLVLTPLARMIERASAMEEDERQKLVEWLAGEVATEVPGGRHGEAAARA
ncbi:chemotaxis protein MotA [Novosphingobium sp. PC22D]|nr:chemotaxis protein MotA [Novosphingobium sp. PC22D]